MAMEAPPSREESRWSIGASLPVKNVQALAESADKLTPITIERYVRPELDRDVVVAEHSCEVPVIDLGKLLNPESVEGETAKLRSACLEWGFFQLVNHGIPEVVTADVTRDMEEFFQLPLDKKNDYAQRPGEIEGYGQAFVFSDDQKLDWGDMLYFVSQPPQNRNMSIWPNEPPTIRSSIEEYSSELLRVAHDVATFIAKTLNVDPTLMVDKCIGQAMRLNYYPPYMPAPEKVIGMSPHFDGCLLTLLLEVNSVEGLQINRHGSWVPIKTQPKALLVNVGDFLEIVTNGKYKSIEHRVTINAHRERLTISAFHIPKYDALLSPILGSAEEKVLYKTVRVQDYRKVYLSKDLNGKRALDIFKVSQT